MRIGIKHLLHTLALSACAYSQSPVCSAQEPGLIQQAAAAPGGQVQTASALQSERSSRGQVTSVAKFTSMTQLTRANSAFQPPASPPLPATRGLIAVPAQENVPATGPLQGSVQANSGGSVGSASNPNALTPLQNRELSIPVQIVDLSLSGIGTGTLPESAADKRDKLPFPGRGAAFKCVYWQPSNICHYPLRFEEPMLERHGHVRFGCWQPLASGVKFFGTLPMLPYLYTLQPTHQPVYALGNYRPGSCAPLLRETIPYDREAAVVEALSLAGFFWAVPL